MSENRIEHALKTLEDFSLKPLVRNEAFCFLLNLEDKGDIQHLITALENDDFSIRWEAAKVLSHMGKRAFPTLLEALVDPKQVGNPRLRDGIYHVLHNMTDHEVRVAVEPLLHAMKGPAADIITMQEAHRLLLDDKFRQHYPTILHDA